MTLDILGNKYPERFLEHFLAMFNADLTQQEIINHVSLTNAMESIDYLKDLKEEMALIINNEDQAPFVAKMIDKGYESFDKEWIDFIFHSVSEFIDKNDE